MYIRTVFIHAYQYFHSNSKWDVSQVSLLLSKRRKSSKLLQNCKPINQVRLYRLIMAIKLMKSMIITKIIQKHLIVKLKKLLSSKSRIKTTPRLKMVKSKRNTQLNKNKIPNLKPKTYKTKK